MQKTNSKIQSLKAKSSKLKALRGFTLMETLIYGVLVAIVIGGVILSLYVLVVSSQAINDKVVVEEEANFMIKKMEWALAGYQTISSPASGASGASLSINKFNYGSNPIVFDLSGGSLRITEGGGSPVPLSSAKVMVSNLNFNHLAAIGTGPDGVKMTMTINGRDFELVTYKK